MKVMMLKKTKAQKLDYHRRPNDIGVVSDTLYEVHRGGGHRGKGYRNAKRNYSRN